MLKNFLTSSKLIYTALALVVLSGLVTYAAFTNYHLISNDPYTVYVLLNLNLALLAVLLGAVAFRVRRKWRAHRRLIMGSHLHVRLVYIFSLLAVTPAILMTVFSAVFFHVGVQTWFSDRVSTAIAESQAVAQAYLEEHKQVIRADILAMANDIDRQVSVVLANGETFERVIRTQSFLRNFSEALVFSEGGEILAGAGMTFTLENEMPGEHLLSRADRGEVVIMTGDSDDRVRALVRLNSLFKTYLIVGRAVDSVVLSHVTKTREATEDYQNLQSRYSSLRLTVTLIFLAVASLLTVAAIWFGLVLARQLSMPLTHLMEASDRVRSGDLSVRVDEHKDIREFAHMAKSFNRMTSQLQQQQEDLLDVNRKLDQRRRFTEAVLEGVSSGVLGVNEDGQVRLVNRASCKLLGMAEQELLQASVTDILPEIQGLLEMAQDRAGKIIQDQLTLKREHGMRIFLVRIVIESLMLEEADTGAIITFDDITDLHAAEKKAAWSDVARRIAHEIKNPLTPIQLSAERLRRRFLPQITEKPEIFEQCTDTIIKHVADIGNMVNEFSEFARMPGVRLERGSVTEPLRETITLFRQAYSNIKFELIGVKTLHEDVRLDVNQIRQAVTNLVQNAVDSLLQMDDERDSLVIRIVTGVLEDGSGVQVSVSDNGPGLPDLERTEDIMEPYVTHKEKGTGLGLAIVKKIMEDHKGELILGARPIDGKVTGNSNALCGAVVSLIFPILRDYKDSVSDGSEVAAA